MRKIQIKMATEKEDRLSVKAKQLLRQKLFSAHFEDYSYIPKYLEEALSKVMGLLERGIVHGESNSLLLIGQRGVGKTWVVEKAFKTLAAKKENNFVRIYLNGLVHTDDYHALIDIKRQLNMSNEKDISVLTHSESLNYLLDSLQSGNKKNQCIVFIVDEFDLFTQHKNQMLLYNLFNITQSPVNPILIIGITCRMDVTELLEKRVRSRFSHRQIYIFPTCTFEQYKDTFISLVQLPRDSVPCADKWNTHITKLAQESQVIGKLYYRFGGNCQNLKIFLSYAVSKVDQELTESLLEASYHCIPLVHCTKLQLMNNLTVLELYLLVTCMHIIKDEQYDFINFELIYQEYHKYASKYSHNSQFFDKPIVFKVLSRLVSLEILYPINSSSTIPTTVLIQYSPLQCMVSENDIIKTVKCFKNCPTDLFYWATNTTAN